MGYYLNPPDSVNRLGRCLTGSDFGLLTGQLRGDEMLVGLYDRLIFKNAVHLYCAEEFEAFEKAYRAGQMVSHDFFAVKKADFPDHYKA